MTEIETAVVKLQDAISKGETLVARAESDRQLIFSDITALIKRAKKQKKTLKSLKSKASASS
jgi:uncharacterized protein YbcI